MTINLNELHGRPVLDLSTAKTVGEIGHAILDPARQSVIAFELAKASGTGNVLPWDSISAIGPDAITIDDVGLLRAPSVATEHRPSEVGSPLGRHVITTQGTDLGSLLDIAFDEHSGTIETIELETGHRPATTVGIGNYALIVEN